MSVSEYFPIYSKLSASDQEALLQVSSLQTVSQGTILHNGGDDCMGLLVVKSGQLRAYMSSEEGREITANPILIVQVSTKELEPRWFALETVRTF